MEFKTLKVIFKHLFNFLVLSSLSFTAVAEVVLIEGHVRAMPASVPNTAAYFVLANPTDKLQRLVAVKTVAAKEAQLHTLLEEDGMVKMRQVSGFDIQAKSQLVLAPTGDHLMLLSLVKPLAIGDKVALELIFEQGESQQIELQVQGADKSEKQDSSHTHHHHH
ncbi:copper chaperone PCu(A)C [Shewanella sp. SR44-3]|uniref:copper chaperone PCu(A)C n=1 Tax=Shewanella sp. SR44-3 TaxID=2760936 RepID=UPI0015FDBEEF|nr:copper chaperone PCu(A)C [Shewanella sp. SR44-3]MBB1268316.1 copper chaperone PCu(A)C [Shewanella sp. SR44-3]